MLDRRFARTSILWKQRTSGGRHGNDVRYSGKVILKVKGKVTSCRMVAVRVRILCFSRREWQAACPS